MFEPIFIPVPTDGLPSNWTDGSGGGGGGGGGGTTNYNELSNLPTINGVQLKGNKTSAQLKVASSETMAKVVEQAVTGFDYNAERLVTKTGVV